jgi:hypothetical protein
MSDILDHTVLTGLVRELFPAANAGAALFSGPLPAPSDSWGFDVMTGKRTPPNYRHRKAAGGNQAALDREKVTMPLITIREKKPISNADIKDLRKPGTEHDRYGEQLVIDELTDLRNLVEIAKEKVRWDILRLGDPSVTISGTAVTLDFKRGQTGHWDVTPAGDDWDGSAPDILGDVGTWKRTVAEDSGMPLTRAWCTSYLMTIMMKDTTVRALLSDSQKDAFTREGWIPRFQGIDWFVYDAGYHDGTNFIPFVNGVSGTADQFIIFATDGFVGEERSCPAPDPEAGDTIGLFAKSYDDDDPSVKWILVHETSLPGLTKPRQVLTAQPTT